MPVFRARLVFFFLLASTTQAAWPFSFKQGGDDDKPKDVLVSPISNREVQVSVSAPSWPSTPQNVLCEAWAWEQPRWAYLDEFVDGGGGGDAVDTYEQATELALRAAESPNLLRYALAMRAQSPTCELHRGLAQGILKKEHKAEADSFAVVYPTGEVAWSAQEVSGLLETCESMKSAFDFDEILLPGETPRVSLGTSSAQHLVVLYADLGTRSFVSFYKELVKSDASFVVRHKGMSDAEASATQSQGTILQGYGARLDIRNVEYKVFDDRGDNDDAKAKNKLINATGMETMINQVFAGVNLTALGIDDAKLQATLWEQHEAQDKHSQLLPPTWQRRQLSLQAAYVISQSGKSESGSLGDPLVTLEEVSQNLPSVASTLVHVKVPDEFGNVVTNIERPLQQMMRSGGGGLWINGRAVSIQRPSFNVFDLIRLLQSEQMGLSKLQSVLSPYFADMDDGGKSALIDVQRAWAMGEDFASSLGSSSSDDDGDEEEDESDDDTAVRINVRSGWRQAVMYLNDIEKDPDYAQWPREVKQMLMSMQYGMPPAVRRNMFTILSVVDPTKPDKPVGMELASQLIQSQYPARAGLLVVAESDIKACSEWILSTKPEDGEPCPMDKPLFEIEDVASQDDLKKITATARVYHRLLSYVANEFKTSKRVVTAYGEYMTSSMYNQVSSRGGPIAVFGMLSIHNQLIQGMQIVSRAPPILDTFRALVKMEEEEKSKKKPEYLYGKAVRFAAEKNLGPGMSFLNGKPLPVPGNDSREKLGQMFMQEQQHIFDLIMAEEITDTEPRSVYAKLLSGDNVFPRIHPLLSENEGPDSFVQPIHEFGINSLVGIEKDDSGEVDTEADAIFVVEAFAAFDTSKGRELVSRFASSMATISTSISGTSIAASYRILPSSKEAADTSLCEVLAHAGLFSAGRVAELLEGGLDELEIDAALDALKGHPDYDDKRCSDIPYLKEPMSKSNYIVANGRVYYPEQSEISRSDIELLMSLGIGQTKAATKMIKAHTKSPSLFDAVANTCAFLSISNVNQESSRSSPIKDIRDMELELGLADDNPLRFEWNQDQDGESLMMNVVAVVDPTTETAQRASSLLRVIRDELKLPLVLILAPRFVLESDAKIPISSYYRFVADPTAYQDGKMPPTARFSNLPTNHILTLRMDVPEPWNIQQTKSIQDTDNLRCDIQSGCSDEDYSKSGDGDREVGDDHITRVEYGLLNLLFAGQCYQSRGSPPNGLQLTLTKRNESDEKSDEQVEIGSDGSIVPAAHRQTEKETAHFSDTVVMKTVGYWQLQAGPGVWSLSIDENSRGHEIFDMVDGSAVRGSIRVKQPNITYPFKRLVMKDFASRSELLVVQRRPGYEKASLFYDDKTNSVATEDETIHVFSLATGHLYERFLKIMMLSVTKRTSSKVKFWLFENFLSPSFKSSATAMAQRIGCEVEFVTYKWPEWLRGQSEKQRIIWGYKILFLDVLFPLSVKKIIYVDADQVVRGDLKELWDMDLHGAPYGYTPFCTSRETTLGFQFWNSGFWASHLRGKPYHISALYVVDLDKFRKTLVGDQLRSIYHSLSADPNSLANLDQDLPNYAQHQVPIFSLPQEWLWCETWCSDETKASSKTIDLCNNPLHKEPKVSMAKRIISGDLFPESWIELDAEVERYEQEHLASLATS